MPIFQGEFNQVNKRIAVSCDKRKERKKKD